MDERVASLSIEIPDQPGHEPTVLPGGRPRLFFFVECEGVALLELLAPPMLELLAQQGYGIALALPQFDETNAAAIRRLNHAAIPVVAWLIPPTTDEVGFSLTNYPRATACYRAFRAWVQAAELQIMAVGIEIEPPLETDEWNTWRLMRVFLRRLWLARDNALYPAARAAYLDLIATIRHDGYEVHTYQIPLIADDRLAGTTLVQRALDIVDLPADVEVLFCSSQMPIDWLADDLGGALIAAYGEVADAIAIGSGPGGHDGMPLGWPSLRRDLLLAAQHTDTIYLTTLEELDKHGMLMQIVTLDWSAHARPAPRRRLMTEVLRTMLFGVLLGARLGWRALAWAGWLCAFVLWLRQRRT